MSIASVIAVKNLNFEIVSAARLPLVNQFYSSCRYKVKCGKSDRVYTLRFGGKIIAAARFLVQKSGYLLLRNLCVAPDMRNQGIATRLLTKALHDLLVTNPINCYCFALPYLKNFYLSLGFEYFSSEDLLQEQVPEDIVEMYIRNCTRKRGWILMGYIIA
ncbi:MAG: N-acetyltransferase [Gammaproteobacteria bacterium]|nr:MAG: N-acetyltransferase [Gammaproteobacteria bacterium]